MKWLPCCFALLFCGVAFSQAPKPERGRYYKAECGTSADYLELTNDGRYRIVDREHMGVIVTEKGRWQQKGTLITFRPDSELRGGEMVREQSRTYVGTELQYKNKVFIAFNAENAAEIVISVADIKRDLDRNPGGTPPYVLFKTSAEAFDRETKQTYPFRYIRPQIEQK